MTTRQLQPALVGILLTLLALGCARGRPKQKPPVHLIQDMYEQPKVLPQDGSDLFPDSSAMRPPVRGTVARGWLEADSAYFMGLEKSSGKEVAQSPVPPSAGNLQRGKERFEIFCTPCHGFQADGKGIMVEKGYVPPPSLYVDRLRAAPEGHFYRVMREGWGNMPSYAQQIPVADRWMIVDYIRSLQNSRVGK